MEVFLQEAAALRHAPSLVVFLFEYLKTIRTCWSFCGSCIRHVEDWSSRPRRRHVILTFFWLSKMPKFIYSISLQTAFWVFTHHLILPSGSTDRWLLSHCGSSWSPLVYYQNWVLDSKLAPIHLDKWALQERDLQETLERQVKTTKYSSLPVRQKECLCHAFEFLLSTNLLSVYPLNIMHEKWF